TLARFQEATKSLRAFQQKLLGEMQRLAMDLAVAIASRFLNSQVHAGSAPMELWIREAIERLDARQPVTVRIHPEDLALLEKRLGPENFLPLNDAEVSFVADPTVRRGGFQ